MQRQSTPSSSRARTIPRWSATAVAVLLSLMAGPAHASNDPSPARAARPRAAAGATGLQRDATELSELDERIVGLERRFDQLGVAGPSLAPTAADLEHAQEEEGQAEFQKQVWTMP